MLILLLKLTNPLFTCFIGCKFGLLPVGHHRRRRRRSAARAPPECFVSFVRRADLIEVEVDKTSE